MRHFAKRIFPVLLISLILLSSGCVKNTKPTGPSAASPPQNFTYNTAPTIENVNDVFTVTVPVGWTVYSKDKDSNSIRLRTKESAVILSVMVIPNSDKNTVVRGIISQIPGAEYIEDGLYTVRDRNGVDWVGVVSYIDPYVKIVSRAGKATDDLYKIISSMKIL